MDIQGAGERKTLITGDGAASVCQDATVLGANDAELRFLTARNTSGSATTCTIAIYYPFGTSSHLTNVTAEATGVGGDLNMGVYGESESNLALTNVTATASGGDLANVGVLSREPTITIRHSKLSGSTNSLNHRSRDGSQVALSQLVGPVSSGLRCFNDYDENMEAVSCR